MRAAVPILASLVIAACSNGYPGPAVQPRAESAQPVPPAANLPEESGDKEIEPDPDNAIVIDFVQRDLHTALHYRALREGRGPIIVEEEALNAFGGGSSMSYDPELRQMGLKVGRDGNLHRVGGDARQPGDPDEGPAVGWDELHRKQFGD